MVVSSKLVAYGTKAGYSSVVADQCIDTSHQQGYRDGKLEPKPNKRHMRQVTMNRAPGGVWKILNVIQETKTC